MSNEDEYLHTLDEVYALLYATSETESSKEELATAISEALHLIDEVLPEGDDEEDDDEEDDEQVDDDDDPEEYEEEVERIEAIR